jgi:hypothetical protein
MGSNMRNTGKQVIDGLKEMRKYWKLKEEAIDPISGELPLEELRNFRKTNSDYRMNEKMNELIK